MRIGLQFICLLAAVVLAGCGTEQSESPAAANAPSEEGQAYLLGDEPTGAQDVIAIRKDAKDGEEVVVVGRIGGSPNPWIEGRAAFSLVDNSLRACSDIPGDKCKIPWDYCCETSKLPTGTLLVKIVDDAGELVRSDSRSLLGLAELATVVVQGKAQRDDAGNVTVLAQRMYVRKP